MCQIHRRGRSAIMLVSLCALLGVAASASAECAWVLWMESPVHSKQWSLRYPYDSPAFETKKECDRAAQHAEAVQTSGLTDATKRGLALEPRSWYVCLPDTVDPRGIAAIYARKSTDQNLPDEAKAVTRQIERARAYAARNGWAVADAHVYADDGISGAEFMKRPGYLALMNALRPRPPFQVLIVMDQSRLGRSLDEVPYASGSPTPASASTAT